MYVYICIIIIIIEYHRTIIIQNNDHNVNQTGVVSR